MERENLNEKKIGLATNVTGPEMGITTAEQATEFIRRGAKYTTKYKNYKGEYVRYNIETQIYIPEYRADLPHLTDEEKKGRKMRCAGLYWSCLLEADKGSQHYTQLTGFLCIDLDHIGDTEAVERAKQNLIEKCPYIYCVFVSPSGDGLKVVLPIDVDTTPRSRDDMIKDLQAYFFAVEEYFSKEFPTLPHIDIKCKNVNRACYISYDPKIYVNAEAQVWTKRKEQEVQTPPTPTEPRTQKPLPSSIGNGEYFYNKDNLALWAEDMRLQGVYICEDYGDWCNLAWSLIALCGESQAKGIFEYVSSYNPKYNPNTIEGDWNTFARSFDPSRISADWIFSQSKRMGLDYTRSRAYEAKSPTRLQSNTRGEKVSKNGTKTSEGVQQPKQEAEPPTKLHGIILQEGATLFKNNLTGYTTIALRRGTHLYLIDNIGEQGNESLTYDYLREFLVLAKENNITVVDVALNYQTKGEAKETTSEGFKRIALPNDFPQTAEATRDKRGLLFVDSWLQSGQNVNVNICDPYGALLLIDGEEVNGSRIFTTAQARTVGDTEDIAEYWKNVGFEVANNYMAENKSEVLEWAFITMGKYIKEPTELERTLIHIFEGADRGTQNRLIRAIQKHENREKFRAVLDCGIDERYLEEVKNKGRDGTTIGQLEKIYTDIGNALNTRSFEAVGGIAKDFQKLQYKNTIAETLKTLNSTYRELESEIQTPNDIETDIWLYRGTHDNKQRDSRLTFSNCGLSVVAAPTKNGKTTFLLDCAIKEARKLVEKAKQTGADPDTILFFSIEEDTAQILTRIYAYCSSEVLKSEGVRHQVRRLVNSDPDSDELRRVRQKADEIANLKPCRIPKQIDEAAAHINAAVDSIRERGGEVRAIFLDYIQLLRKEQKSYDRTDEMSYICGVLNDITKSLKIGIITAAQFNREVKGGLRMDDWNVSHIGESQSIENIATDVYLLASSQECQKIIGREMKISEEKDEKKRRPMSERAKCITAHKDWTKHPYFYLERIKSREHRSGGFATVPTNLDYGIIEPQKDEGEDEVGENEVQNADRNTPPTTGVFGSDMGDFDTMFKKL